MRKHVGPGSSILSRAIAPLVAVCAAAAYAAPLPPVSSGSLLVHLKADAANVVLGDDNVVTQWNDLSSNANHFFQTDAGRQPTWVSGALGGRPVIRFTNDWLDTGTGLNTADRLPFTFLAVTSNTLNPFALFDSAPSVQNPFRFGAFGAPFGSPNYAVEFWDRAPGVPLGLEPRGSIVSVTGYRNETSNRVLEARESSLHGTTSTSAVGNTNPVAFGGNGGPNIGTINSGNNGFYAGDLAELIIFNGRLSSTDLVAVEQYLSNEYGIGQLPPPPSATPSAPANYGQAVLASQPVAFWRLETNDAAPSDSADASGFPQFGAQNGRYQDISPQSLAQPGPRPGDLVNGQPLLGFAPDNKAINFRGPAGGGNDVVLFADDGNLNLSAGATFTLEAWVKAQPVQEQGGAIIAKGAGGGGEQFAIDLVNGAYRFFLWNGGTPNTPTVVQSSVQPNGEWQHVVGVLDSAEGLMKLYVNGAEVGSTTPPATIISNLDDVSIGSRRGSTGEIYNLNFTGLIDEVAIYPYALPAGTIQEHFQAAFVPEPSVAALGMMAAVWFASARRRSPR